MYNHRLKYVTDIIHKNYWGQFAVGLCLGTIAIVILLLIPTDWPLKTKILIFILSAIVGNIGLAFAIITAYYIISNNSKLQNSLQQNPENIVWVYAQVLTNMPFGVKVFSIAIVYCKYIDNSSDTFYVSPKKLDLTLKKLNKLLPHATFGYSLTKEQLYRANPMLMYQSDSKDYHLT